MYFGKSEQGVPQGPLAAKALPTNPEPQPPLGTRACIQPFLKLGIDMSFTNTDIDHAHSVWLKDLGFKAGFVA